MIIWKPLKGSGELFEKRIWGFFLLLTLTVMMAACNTDTEADPNVESDDNAKKYSDVFEETDAIAHNFMVVKIEQNYPEVIKYMSPKGIEELEAKVSYLLDNHEYPNRFDELDGMYELRRYDNFYDNENREVIYRYRKPDNKNVLINDWIILTQDDKKEWKVRSYYDSRPGIINDENAETGTVLHELPEEE